MKRKIAGILTMIMVFGVVFLSLPIMQTASAETVYNCSNLTNIKIPVGVADIGLLNSGVGTPRSFSISALEADLPLLKVGFIAPLSDSYGQSARNGFDLALEQADYKAGGYSIEPIYQDDESDAAQAGSAANSLISQGVKAIVGSVNSNSTRPISAIADNHSVVLITGTASDPLVTVTNNERKSYVFRTCIIDAYESLAAADFVKNDLEKSTAAVLYSTDDSYYLPMASGFNNAFKSAGGQVLYYGSVSLESLDAKALSELSSLNPDVIYLACSDDQANTVASQILAAKNNPVFIGSSNWTWFGSLATDTFLNGSYFTSCYANDDPNQSNEAFKTAYKTKYRVEPDDTAALFYDAAKVLVNAINTSNSSDSTAIRDALQATTDFSGVSGDISYYTSSGNPCKQVVIQQVQNGGVKYITRKSGEGEDAIPPELTEVTAGTIEVGNDITATSNEDGYIYLVPADTNKTAAAVRAAGEGDNGRKAAVTLETEVIINTAGLEAGSYKVFAIDTLGNLSAGSDNINIYDSGTSETWVDWPETKQKSNTESLTITFNKAVDFTTANKTNIFVATDSEGTNQVSGITVEQAEDNPCQVKVMPPDNGWQTGSAYYLFISSQVKSSAGRTLKSGRRMQFTVANAEPAAVVVNGIVVDEDTPGRVTLSTASDTSLATIQAGISISGQSLSWQQNDARTFIATITDAVRGQTYTFTLNSDFSLAQGIDAMVQWEEENLPFTLSTTSFTDGSSIPLKYAMGYAGGQNVSPSLSWQNTPAGTKSLALLVYDPDGGNWVHWAVSGIPASTASLTEGASLRSMPAGCQEYINEFGDRGWGGPGPPAGELHHYKFILYALSTSSISISSAPSYTSFVNALSGKILDQAEIGGTYRR